MPVTPPKNQKNVTNATRKPGVSKSNVKNLQNTKQNRNKVVNKSDKNNSGQISSESSDAKETKKLVTANILMCGALLFSVIANVCLAWYAVSAKIALFATTETGKVIMPAPLQQAFVTEPRVLSFVDECLRDSFSHDFENYRRTMNRALPCYTSGGGKEFNKAIDPTLQEIRSKRLVVSITTEPPALIRGPMLIEGRATWEIQSVITLFYQGARDRYPPQTRLATVTVVRVPLEENLRGVSINAIQLKPYIRQ